MDDLTTKLLVLTEKLLKLVVDFNPRIDASDDGQCFYCGAVLDFEAPHESSCPYVLAQEILMKHEK